MNRNTLLTSAAGLAALAGLSYLYSSVSTLAIASAPPAPVVQASIPEIMPQIVREMVPAGYREKFEQFLAETDPLPKNKPVRLAAVDPDTSAIAVAMRAPPVPVSHTSPATLPCTPISAEQSAPPRNRYF